MDKFYFFLLKISETIFKKSKKDNWLSELFRDQNLIIFIKFCFFKNYIKDNNNLR